MVPQLLPVAATERVQPRNPELTIFPYLNESEFKAACNAMSIRFDLHGCCQEEWSAVESIYQDDITFLRITKPLVRPSQPLNPSDGTGEEEIAEEDDDEVAETAASSQAVLYYDVVLSPSYRVPVLYFTVSDRQHRYPPTMDTLYSCVIPPMFRTQAERIGVIGGITVTDHPATNKPVFFIHPCQTAEVMVASVGEQAIPAYDYLLIWMGALGKFVGLDVPLSLVKPN